MESQELKKKLSELADHLKEINRLKEEIENGTDIGFCIWPKELHVAHGLNSIKDATGIEIEDTFPFGKNYETHHKSIVIDGIDFFTPQVK
ncbi:MAG: hypothetical protein ACM3TR_09690 [Caulobacteraceae bacterium]